MVLRTQKKTLITEERTYWQAPDVYFQMSLFSYADKIKTSREMNTWLERYVKNAEVK